MRVSSHFRNSGTAATVALSYSVVLFMSITLGDAGSAFNGPSPSVGIARRRRTRSIGVEAGCFLSDKSESLRLRFFLKRLKPAGSRLGVLFCIEFCPSQPGLELEQYETEFPGHSNAFLQLQPCPRLGGRARRSRKRRDHLRL